MNKVYCYYYCRGWENCATSGYVEVASKNMQLAIISNNNDNNGDFNNVQRCNTAKNSDHEKLFLKQKQLCLSTELELKPYDLSLKSIKKQFCHSSEYQSPVKNS